MNDLIEILKASSEVVEVQAMDNPGIAIPVDPDLADFLGAFVDAAINQNDFELEA